MERTKIIAKLFSATIFWIVVAILVILLAIVFWGMPLWKNVDYVRLDAVINICCGLIGASIIYVLTFLFLGRFMEMSRQTENQETIVDPLLSAFAIYNKSIYSKIADINWEELFNDADEIFLIVQGWDGWHEKVAPYLPDFLKKGNKINVILHDPLEKDLLFHMGERMGRGLDEEKREIELTATNLKQLTLTIPEQLELYYTRKINWYCGIYFKSNNSIQGKLLLSIYRHKPTGQFAINLVPSFLIHTGVHKQLGKWFMDEWEYLSDISNSRRG